MGFLDTVNAAFDSAVKVFSNKSIDLGANTITGTVAQFNTACTDADFAALVGTEAAATPSVLAKRDANGNLLAASFLPTAPFTVTSGGTTTVTVAGGGVQIFTGTSAHTAKLDSSFAAGHPVVIINRSTGNVSITASDNSNITTIISLQVAILWAVQATPTVSTHWQFLRTFTITSAATGSTIAQRDGNTLLFTANFIPNLTPTTTAGGTTTLSVGSAYTQVAIGSSGQTFVLPSTTVAVGHGHEFFNESSAAITINSSAGNLVKSLAAGGYCKVRAKQATPTADTHWAKS